MTLETKFIEKFGKNRFLMFYLKTYKRIYSYLWGIKKNMPFRVKMAFSLHNKVETGGGRKNCFSFGRGRYSGNFFRMHGSHNVIRIGEGGSVANVRFEIFGDDNTIEIGDRVVLRDAHIHLGDNGSSLRIGDDTDIGSGFHASILEGANVTIGSDCMFSWNTSLMNSDAHSIIDLTTKCRINKAADIFIGNHVWFGQDVTVLKGAKIMDNTMVGNRSMVTRGEYEGNSVYIGQPARLLRTGVQWLNER